MMWDRLCVLLLLLAGVRCEEAATTGEPLTLGVLGDGLENALDGFRGTVVNSVMNTAEKKMEKLGITDAFDAAFSDAQVLSDLKDKIVDGLSDMTAFFEGGEAFDGIDMVMDQLAPAMDMMSGVCSQETGEARREAAFLQAKEKFLREKEEKAKMGPKNRTANAAAAAFARPLFTATLGVSLPELPIQLTTNWKAAFQVGGGLSIGVNTAKAEIFYGIGVGLSFGFSKGQKECLTDDECPSKSSVRAAAVCENQKCVQMCDPNDASTCGPEEACDNLRCVVVCTADNQCGSGEICDHPDGTDRCVPALCTQASDCDVNMGCAHGRCYPFSCMGPADCPKAGETCENGQCVPEHGTLCDGPADCAAGQICVEGLCEEDPRSGCTGDADCMVSGETCRPSVNRCGVACTAAGMECDLGEECNVDICVDDGILKRRASVLADVPTPTKQGFWSKVGDSVGVSLDWFKEAGSFSGFAFQVAISNSFLKDKYGIQDIHVTLGHPHYQCLGEKDMTSAKWWGGVVFGGVGVTLAPVEDPPSSKPKKETAQLVLGNSDKFLTLKEAFPQDLMNVQNDLVDLLKSFDGISFAESITLEDTNDGVSLKYASKDCPGASNGRAAEAQAETQEEEKVAAKVEEQEQGRDAEVQGDAASELVSFLKQATNIVTKGEILMPFCAGNCGPTNSSLDSIIGVGRVGPPKTCNGVEASVSVDTLTVGSLAYLITAGELASVGKTMMESDIMKTVLSLGIQDTTLSFGVTTDGIKMAAVGSPLLPDTNSHFVAVLKDMTEEIQLGASASLAYSGVLELELRVGTEADTDDSQAFRVSDATGTYGASTYMRYIVEAIGSTVPPRQELGMTFPFIVCVDKCNDLEKRKDIYFNGDLGIIVTPTAQILRGSITAAGWWYESFEIPFIHLGDMVLGLDWDMKSPLPTGLVLGAAACIGRQDNCVDQVQPYVEARAYIGLSATLPEDNYFVVMVSELTIGSIADFVSAEVPWLVLLTGEASAAGLAAAEAAFEALGVDVSEVTSTLQNIQKALPPQFAESGLYPFDKDYKTKCTPPAADADVTEINKDCYAYMSFSPLKEQTLELGLSTLVVPKGLAFAGRLNFIGWEMAAEVAISPTQFYVNATMDHIALKFGSVDFIRIGSHLNAQKKAAGGARFLVDLNIAPPRAEVNIQGAFDIPLLRSYGALLLIVDSEKLHFKGEMNLFDGALKSTTEVYFPWDFTSFHMSLSDMIFLHGVVKVKEVMFEYDTKAPMPYAIFNSEISVLFAVNAKTTLSVQGDTIDFSLAVAVLGVQNTISGTAVINTNNFLNSEFDITVTSDLDPTVVIEAVVDGAKAVASTAVGVWNTVSGKVSAAWNSVKNQFTRAPLNYLANAIGGFLSDMETVLRDIASALSKAKLSNLVSLSKDFTKGDFSSLGDATFNLGGAMGIAGTKHHTEVDAEDGVNEYGCRWKKIRYQECFMTPKVCIPKKCTGGICAPQTCTDRKCEKFCIGCCGKRKCTKKCIPGVCTPGECTPVVCTPASCTPAFETCGDHKYGERFPDKECMEDIAHAAKQVEDDLIVMKRQDDAVTSSKAKNPALAGLAAGTTVPQATVKTVVLKFPVGQKSTTGNLVSDVGVLAGPCGGAGGTQRAEVNGAAFNMDSHKNYKASIKAAQQALSSGIESKLLSKQCGLDSEILDEV